MAYPVPKVATAVIANNESLSSAVIVGGRHLVLLEVPEITSATLSFQVCVDQTADPLVYQDLYTDDGTEYTVGSASTGARTFLLPWLAGVYAFKVRSGTSGSPVNQGAERTFVVSANSK